MIKGVIFDLDGTMLDSIDAFWWAFNAAVVTFKLEPVAKERLLGLMNQGASLAEILSDIYPVLRTEPVSLKVQEIMAKIKEEFLAHSKDEVGLTSGAQELFSLLRLKGIKMGIVTSRAVAPEKQWHELRKLRVAYFIDAIVTGAEIPRKPAPDAIIECLKQLALLPEECIFVGDSQADMRAAKAAGVKSMAITTGVGGMEGLSAESPDFIFDNLLKFIDKLDFILSGYQNKNI